MKYYNTSGGYEEVVVVTDDSTFFNRPNPAFDEDSGIDDPLDRRGDRPSRPAATMFTENFQAAQAAEAAAAEAVLQAASVPVFETSTFDYSTIDWSGSFDNASIGAGQSLAESAAEEVLDSELIMGCTDEQALNYDPNAAVNDGLCTYQDSGNNNTETKKDNNTLKMAVAGLAVLAIFVAIKK